MKKLSLFLAVAIVLLAACIEPVYKLEDLDKYPTIPSFPKEFQGAFESNKDSLIVQKSGFRIVSTDPDMPKSGELGVTIFLRKHGAYHAVYSTYGEDFYHLRFFSFSGQTLVVKKIKDDAESIAKIKTLATSYIAEPDINGLTDDQYFFTINGKILETLMAQYLQEEYFLNKVK